MDTTPREDELWEGLGGHFESLNQVIAEFVDNSIANFLGENTDQRNVHILFNQLDDDTVKVRIDDTGTGIEDFEPVLRIGDKSVRNAPLNEHGFGLKHALASANPDNDKWTIYTRTESDVSSNEFRMVESPYRFDMDPVTVDASSTEWPGRFHGTGTAVEFECSMTFFDTLQQGIPGDAGFERSLDYLREDLGYKYAGVIESEGLLIKVGTDSGYSKSVSAVTPDWTEYYEPRTGSRDLDLGDGPVTVKYEFGEVEESDEYIRHYQRNMSTSGVELRINGRVMTDNLFSEIWNLEQHPQYNHFLARINLVSDDLERLPTTKTSKDGIRSGDEKLKKVYEWIRNTRPEPPRRLTSTVRETGLVEELKEAKETHTRSDDARVIKEYSVYESLDAEVDVDLYFYDGNDVVLYEAKKGTADLQALYQLLMYWNGAVRDGITPEEGILIATEMSDGVETVLNELNDEEDAEGNEYNFTFKTWKDEGVDFPD